MGKSAESHLTIRSPFLRNAPVPSHEKDHPFSTSLLTERRSGAYGRCNAVMYSFKAEQNRRTFLRVLTTPFAVWTYVGVGASKTSSSGFSLLILCSEAPESTMEFHSSAEHFANATFDFFIFDLLVLLGRNFECSCLMRFPFTESSGPVGPAEPAVSALPTSSEQSVLVRNSLGKNLGPVTAAPSLRTREQREPTPRSSETSFQPSTAHFTCLLGPTENS